MQFFGRLHPLLVHLPIGILLLSFGLECLARWQNRSDLRPAIRLALGAGAVSAVLTAGTGWWLARQGGYEETLLQQHQWLGIGAATTALASWLGQRRPWYFPLFAVSVLILSVAGHFGGTLTHGANYLFETETAAAPAPGADAATAHPDSTVFAGFIQPILKSKCTSCHNAGKQKGRLRLDGADFIQKGGKHGAVLDTLQPENSTLLHHILLPLNDDDHMPPMGKPQLSALEKQLLEWWVGQGVGFRQKVRDAAFPEALEQALQEAQGLGRNPVYALPVAAAPASALEELRAGFIHVAQLGGEAPWLAVSFAGQPNLAPPQWKALRRIEEQTTELDLAHTRLDDKALGELSGFSHLVRLNLAHTRISDASGPVLQSFGYLESLNLTGTAVTDKLLESLTPLSHLQRLYVWQTAITPDAVSRLQQLRPDLYVETGAQHVDTAMLALRPPRIVYGRSFFDDTLQVTLEYPAFRGVSLYYTIDEAASPTTQSERYRQPVVLNQTAHVRAFAAREGWLPSPVVDAVLVKKQYTAVQASLAKPPSPKYPAKGAASLIDGKIGDLQGADTWLGYEGEHLSAVIDLGAPKPISQVFVHCLENNVSWIFKPTGIQVETSLDGKTFTPQGKQQFPVNTGMGEQKTHLLACPVRQPVETRYVRLLVSSPLKNPEWHPGKGQKCWIFVDEVVVE